MSTSRPPQSWLGRLARAFRRSRSAVAIGRDAQATTRLFLALALLALIAPGTARAASATTRPRPNILFVLIDDLGYGDLGCFAGAGGRGKTPNIDRLAADGVRFEQFYVSSPICSPSRVALTTGQYPQRWRITSFLASREENRRRGMADWLDPKAPTLPRILQESGYHTAHIGKWHMGGQRDVGDAPPITQYGFDVSLTNFEGLGPRILPKFETIPRHGPTDTSARFGGAGATFVDRHRVSAAFVDRAIAEMDAAARAGRPFYINLWPDDVHSPVQAPPELRGDGTPAAQYAGVLTELDRQLGRAFDHVRGDPRLRDDTIILLCSDNGHEPGLGTPGGGGGRGGGGLRGHKGTLYEGGIRSPLIAWSPRRLARPRRGTTDAATVIAGIDIPPSLLSLAGVPTPADVKFDGQDMSAALRGAAAAATTVTTGAATTGAATTATAATATTAVATTAAAERSAPVMWSRPPDRPGPRGMFPDLAIRRGNWKLLVERDGARAELFDVRQDPAETDNRAAAEPQLVRELTAQLLKWDQSHGGHR